MALLRISGSISIKEHHASWAAFLSTMIKEPKLMKFFKISPKILSSISSELSPSIEKKQKKLLKPSPTRINQHSNQNPQKISKSNLKLKKEGKPKSNKEGRHNSKGGGRENPDVRAGLDQEIAVNVDLKVVPVAVVAVPAVLLRKVKTDIENLDS